MNVRTTIRLGVSATVVAALLLPFLFGFNAYVVDLLIDMALWAAIGIGLNVVIGFAGLLDLGYMAFYAFGGYAYAILSTTVHLSMWLAFPVALAAAASAGVLLGAPTLRLRGDYLAIMTLGFGEIVYLTANNLSITGGPNGIYGMPTPVFFGQPMNLTDFYYLALVLVVLAAVVMLRVRQSKLGRAWAYIREDESAASVVGINPTMMKLFAYVMGAMWAGLAGVIFVAKQGLISPETFTFEQSFFAVAVVILGGMGSIPGVIAGGVLYVVISEVFQGITGQYSGLVFSGLMLLIILLRPAGLIPSRIRQREIEAQRETQP